MKSIKVKHRVLVIDDDPDDHFFIKNAIREADLDIDLLAVYNGLQALDLLKQCVEEVGCKLPNLIICDMNMPIMNGLVFLQTLKRHKSLLKIPVFMLSTNCDENEKQQLLALGAIDCIAKPSYSANYKIIIAHMLNSIEAFDSPT